jgi:cellobiose phosphorylase
MQKAASKKINTRWVFTDDEGSFRWVNPHTWNQLYFPVCNEAGMMSSLTPRLNGDAKTGQHTFLLLPVSVEDLHNNRSVRNFWIYNEKLGPYSLTGNSARQIAALFTEKDTVTTTIEGEHLVHRLIREDKDAGLKSEIVSFCPPTEDQLELMWVKITNISDKPMTFTPTTAVPIFGRSAENIRDHKHATSMIHRQETNKNGVIVTPVIFHDERGHKPNNVSYYVMAVDGEGHDPVGQFPTVIEFIGEGSSFDWPEAVVKNLTPSKEAPVRRDGKESIGALRFKEVTLKPSETKNYIVMLGATEDKTSIPKVIEKFKNTRLVEEAYQATRKHWKEKIDRITFQSGDPNFSKWMRWIAVQPILRKIYGCSFLPHHDYGKGGRGWRDLWQDCLALLLQSPDEVRQILIHNFAGIRLDGTNATMILKGLGNFAADRNSISRVWMDHGVWPYFTTKLYIDQTGDIEILLQDMVYWKDHQNRRAKARDFHWTPAQGNEVKAKSGEIYKGTLFEHMLVQHLTCFYNVGEHGNMKLEDADWNDQLDMASKRGESVPFSAFYGWNLISMAETLLKLQEKTHIHEIGIMKEMMLLTGLVQKTDLASVEAKQKRLQEYFDLIEMGISGEKVFIEIKALAEDLRKKGEWVLNHIRTKEWIDSKTGNSFFNGYYNNDGVAVDGDHPDATRMNLTAQTFATMSGAATDEQVVKSYKAAGALLKDPNTKGYRLTTPLGPNTMNFGRGFALVYGEKETGAMFSHMAVMYTNALYRRGFVREGFEVFSSIYGLCNNTEKAQIYPGIPEYISSEGRGMYHYLTGSASWMLMTVLTQIYGVKGELGDLVLEPKLVKEQFDAKGEAKVRAYFAGKHLEIVYQNPKKLDYSDYQIRLLKVNGKEIRSASSNAKKAKILKKDFPSLFTQPLNLVEALLG